VGTTLKVINNTGNDFITGKFDNLAQGQQVKFTYNGITYPFVANYYGGSGNDLVLQWANVRVFGWGSNNSSQLGIGAASGAMLLPTPVLASGVLAGKTVIALAAGNTHSLALCSDGTLAAWGYNGYGQLGDGTRDTGNVPVAVSRAFLAGKTVIAIAAGENFSEALCSDGTVAYWGRIQINYSNGTLGFFDSWVPEIMPPTGVLAGKTVTGIAVGKRCFFARCSDGTVAGWGNNDSGTLGNNSYADAPGAVAADRSGVLSGKIVTAFAASAHGLALTADGTLAAWGSNSSGQLGNSSTATTA
jgi:alpha-tubulin suppressor-like RCC1 family protein